MKFFVALLHYLYFYNSVSMVTLLFEETARLHFSVDLARAIFELNSLYDETDAKK